MGNPFSYEFSLQRRIDSANHQSTKALIILSTKLIFFFSLCLSLLARVYTRVVTPPLLTSSINLATSLLAGFVIFAVLGYMAEIRNVSIDQLGLEGLVDLISFFNMLAFLKFGYFEIVE